MGLTQQMELQSVEKGECSGRSILVSRDLKRSKRALTGGKDVSNQQKSLNRSDIMGMIKLYIYNSEDTALESN